MPALRSRSPRARFPGLCLLAILVPPAARADPILEEGFEAPAWHAGQILPPGSTVNGWTNSSTQALVHVGTRNPDSGTQALHMRFLGAPPAPGTVDTFAQVDHAINYTPAIQGVAPITYSADVRLAGPSGGTAATNDYVSANLVAMGNGGEIGQMYLSSDGHVYAGTNGSIVVPASLGTYHDMAMTFDFADSQTSYYLDGQLIGTQSINPATMSELTDVQLDGVAEGASGYNPYRYHLAFDNILVVDSGPEPASLTLLGLGIAGLAVRRLRRRREGTGTDFAARTP